MAFLPGGMTLYDFNNLCHIQLENENKRIDDSEFSKFIDELGIVNNEKNNV